MANQPVDEPVEDPLAGTSDAFTLDHAAWASLNGPHRKYAQIRGRAACYVPEISPFAALSPDADSEVWHDVAALVGPGGVVAVAGSTLTPPADWAVVWRGEGVQMVAAGLDPIEDRHVVRLGRDDVPEMLDLVSRAQPGPFRARTIELGHYLGIRHQGALIAMAGERLRPPGWTEISAVCTDAAHRGEGLASRLVRSVAAGIVDRGDRPFLHAASNNTNAIRLYRSLGFRLRRTVTFQQVQVPGGDPTAAT